MTKNYIEETDVTIVRNSGDHKTYFTVEVDTHFNKKEAEIFYQYISLYHNYRRTLVTEGISKENQS